VEPAAMPRWAAADLLRPVPGEYIEGKFDWGDVLSLYRDKLAVWNGATCALPIAGEGFVCFYRDDLFKEPARQAAFRRQYHRDLAAPVTWDDFTDIAEFFHGDKQIASLPPLPANDEELDREFYALVAPYARRAVARDAPRPSEDEMFSFHYDLTTGEPRINSAPFVYGLGLLQRLQPLRAGGTATPADVFRQGKAVLCLADASWVGRFQEQDSPVRGRFGICAIPGSSRYFDYTDGRERRVPEVNRIPYLGGAGLLGVVPRKAAEPAAAFALLAALGGPQTSLEMVMEPAWGGDVFRESQFAHRDSWDTFELTPARTNSLLDALRTTVEPAALNPVIRLRTPDERSHLQALVREIRAALADLKVKPQAALANATARWRQLDASKSPADRLRAYRLSLGLLNRH
jgi:multiple sugar transport system substrate-binding protein